MPARIARIAVALTTFACAAPAAASPVLVFDAGRVRKADDPALPAATGDPASGEPRECNTAIDTTLTKSSKHFGRVASVAPPVGRAAAISVGRALRRVYDRGSIDRETYSGYKGVYSDAKRAWRRLSGSRKAELAAVIATVNQLAVRGQLSASRMAPVFLELQRNTEWWTRTSRSPSSEPSEGDTHVPRKQSACRTAARIAAARVQFKGDPLTLQHYPGNGLRLQPLANFGKANALYNACKGIDTEPGTPCEPDKLRELLDRLVATAARRGGFLAWEYYFPFGGGRPPWVSGIATGSALSALARGASLFREQEQQPPAQPTPEGGVAPGTAPPAAEPVHDSAFYLDVARRALPVYEHSAPLGIRASGPRGNHYLIYSFNRGLRVGNSFLESLIGLWDYWQVSGDKRARSLWIRGDREARYELPRYDTGAWSLYSLGGAESDLNYHRVIRDFAENLCERTRLSHYCSKAERFDRYLYQPARVRIAGPRTARAKKPTRISIRVDKLSCLVIQILRGDTVVYQPVWYFPRGTHSFTWTPPRPGTYRIHVLARDLMSRQSRADADLRVLSRRR